MAGRGDPHLAGAVVDESHGLAGGYGDGGRRVAAVGISDGYCFRGGRRRSFGTGRGHFSRAWRRRRRGRLVPVIHKKQYRSYNHHHDCD